MQETWVLSLGQEDALEKGIAAHSSILAWRIPWTEEPGQLQSMGSQRVRHDWMTFTSLHIVVEYPPVVFQEVQGQFDFFFFFLISIWLCWVFIVPCVTFSCDLQTLSCCMEDPVPWPGIKPRPPALAAWSLSHWTSREIPTIWFLKICMWAGFDLLKKIMYLFIFGCVWS